MSNLSSLYAKMGRDREARVWHERARKFLLRNPYFHFDEGAQAGEMGDYRRAIEQYRAALRLKPTEHRFHLAMAKAYVRLGEIGEAEKWLRSALKNATDDDARRRCSEKLQRVQGPHACPTAKARDAARGTAHSRGYTRQWMRYSHARLAEHPWCVGYPTRHHVYVLASVTDHILSAKARPDLFWDEKNHQSLCLDCHARKTRAEGGRL